MKKIIHFKFAMFFTLLLFASIAFGQSSEASASVCSGANDYYKVGKTEGSTYQWTIPSQATAVYGIDSKSDSIAVKWSTVNSVVETTIQVVETNQYGYKGEPVIVNVKLFPNPTATISGSDTLLEGNSGTNKVSIDLVGSAPWEVVYNDGKRDVTVDNIDSSPYSLQTRPLAFPPIEHSFTLVSISDVSGCSGSVSGAAKIVVVPPVKTGPIIHK